MSESPLVWWLFIDYTAVENDRCYEDVLVCQFRTFCVSVAFKLDYVGLEEEIEITAHDTHVAVDLPREIADRRHVLPFDCPQ